LTGNGKRERESTQRKQRTKLNRKESENVSDVRNGLTKSRPFRIITSFIRIKTGISSQLDIAWSVRDTWGEQMNRLDCFCEIDATIRDANGKPIACKGSNLLVLTVDGEAVAQVMHSSVEWHGSKSPFPTPPGGPWQMEYKSYKEKFDGPAFFIGSDRETFIWFHGAEHKSDGCFVHPKDSAGNHFMRVCAENKDGLLAYQNDVIDHRTQEEIDEYREAFPLFDYSNMDKIG
jgi:hypothetical protein